MTLKDALAVILPAIGGTAAVYATGYICRQAQSVKNRAADFHMIGSMGMASSIGLGIALARPAKKIAVIDGDGAVLMNLGNLAMVGAFMPKNFLHIVLDNESYESTGAQDSLSRKIPLDRVARASGYVSAVSVKTAARLRGALSAMLKKKGPSFLLVKVQTDPKPVSARIAKTPEQITRAFREALR